MAKRADDPEKSYVPIVNPKASRQQMSDMEFSQLGQTRQKSTVIYLPSTVIHTVASKVNK